MAEMLSFNIFEKIAASKVRTPSFYLKKKKTQGHCFFKGKNWGTWRYWAGAGRARKM